MQSPQALGLTAYLRRTNKMTMRKDQRLHLVDHGYKFKKIMSGRKWIGRVTRHADGSFLGIIGAISVKCATELSAFNEAGARFFGYACASDLRKANAAERLKRSELKREADRVVSDLMRGDFEDAVNRILGRN
jgi:hypothetical protein